eukprot:CAMPEP_0184677544 /NCGR_PEP_ID=MMETSP0312-20130426/115_1 /TAXON_ID=31354 /ORGANISM="Compsopogon coeruleus, Strain SAG 36.94" /LENGTH=48 /DNA_ID= /DNA_START= /DNA_END= /DNA_ORIENTATION=
MAQHVLGWAILEKSRRERDQHRAQPVDRIVDMESRGGLIREELAQRVA